MKTLTAFVAAAALASSVSIASAQSTMQPGTAGGGASSGSAAAFCLDQQGSKNCKYQTMAACQKDAGASGQCMPNPNRSTTGTGSSGMSGSSTSPGGSSSVPR